MKLRKFLLILFIALFSVCLFSCDSTFSALAPKKETVYLSLNSKVAIEALVETEGKGKLTVTVDDAEILGLDGSNIIGKREGESYVTVSSGALSCRIKIVVVDKMRVTVKAVGGEYIYDGEAKLPIIEGSLPKDTQVEFYYLNGEKFDGATVPGVYEVIAEIKPPEGFYVEYTEKKAVITIKKRFLDLSYLDFSSASYVYDGNEKAIEIEGELPEYVSVTYKNNRAVNAGDYTAEAIFSADESLYESIPTRYARLQIRRKTFEVDYSSFMAQTVTYDGRTHIPSVQVPEGLSVSLSARTSDGEYMPIDKFLTENAESEPFKRSGVYGARATFTVDKEYALNYEPVPEAQITLNIKKARFIDNTAWQTSGADTNGNFYYDGSPITVTRGETARGLSLTGALPTGINGEYREGVKITFKINKESGETVSVTDAGTYTVTCVYTMPEDESWRVNYEPLENKTYILVVEKAKYPTEFSFEATDEEGVDFVSAQVYDGKTHYFKLKFSTDGDEARFMREANVTYYYETANDRVESEEHIGIREAAVYTVGCKLEFKKDEELLSIRRNYYLPSELKFKAEITPKIFDMKNVKFVTVENGAPLNDITYDGLPHSLTVAGLPDGVSAEYTGNGAIDAGEYTVKAEFYAVGILPQSCRLLRDGKTLSSLSAKLTIKKAFYNEEDVPTYVAEGGEYDPTKKLEAYEIVGDNSQYVKWSEPSAVPTCDRTEYSAVYNTDKKNFNDFYFTVTLIITPIVFNADKVEVKDQMVMLGEKPRVAYDGEKADFYELSYTAENQVNGIGSYKLSDISVRLTDNVNYRTDGNTRDFEDIVIHVYNGNIFAYDDLKMQLIKYKGISSEIVVPDGTESIGRGAFANTGTEKLTLPLSLEFMRIDSLINMGSLREIELPFIGTSKESGENFAIIFGDEGAPPSLSKITVTDMTDIPPRAFENLTDVEEIVFTKGINTVGESAFYGSGILSADFAGAVEVGSYAVSRCFNLKSLSLAFLGGNAKETSAISYLLGANANDNTYDNYSLETLDLSESKLSYLPDDAFRNLSRLKKIILPESLETIGKGAFFDVSAEINLSEGITEIGTRAFYGYKGAGLTLPKSLKRIETRAFADATGLERLDIPATVTFIGEKAFENVRGTVAFDGGSEIIRIEAKTFAEYKGSAMRIPDKVAEIADGAFENSNIEYITVKRDVILGDGVFKGCQYLREAEILIEEIPFATFENCVNLTRVSIPYINKVADRAFYGCVKLADIAFTSEVNSIGARAFYGCDGLKFMTFSSDTPPAFTSTSFPTARIINVYVSEAAVATYLKAFEAAYPNLAVSVKG